MCIRDSVGIMFDVYADRAIHVRGFDWGVTSLGQHRVWVYVRKTSTCIGLQCSFRSHESNQTGWALITPQDGLIVTVNSSLIASIHVDDTVVSGGSKRGFMLLANNSVNYGDGNSPRAQCLDGGTS